MDRFERISDTIIRGVATLGFAWLILMGIIILALGVYCLLGILLQ